MSHVEEGWRREDRTRYGLRRLPAHDYQEQLRGPILLRAASVRGVSGEEKTETEMKQLATALTELTCFQREQQQRFEEAQKRQEERQDREEETRRREYEAHQLQVALMREQHEAQIGALREAMTERKNAAKAAHLKIVPFEEKEDIQDFLNAFEGIMTIQEVGKAEWVLRLTPSLLSGKARTVCTKLGPTVKYDGVKGAIL